MGWLIPCSPCFFLSSFSSFSSSLFLSFFFSSFLQIINSRIDDWNNKYQNLVESSEPTFDKAVALGLKLNGFIGSFLSAAKTYPLLSLSSFLSLSSVSPPPLPPLLLLLVSSLPLLSPP
jgi:hypothetical protein